MAHESFEDDADRRGHERALRERQGRPRGAPGRRRDLHGRRPGDDRSGRLADDRVPRPRTADRSTAAPTSRRSATDRCPRSSSCSMPCRRPGRTQRDQLLRAGRPPHRRARAGRPDGRRRRCPRPRRARPCRRPPARGLRRGLGWVRRRAQVPDAAEPRTSSCAALVRAGAARSSRTIAETTLDAMASGRHVRPPRRRLRPLLGRPALGRAPLREDALRPVGPAPPVPARPPGHRTRALRAGRGGDGRATCCGTCASRAGASRRPRTPTPSTPTAAARRGRSTPSPPTRSGRRSTAPLASMRLGRRGAGLVGAGPSRPTSRAGGSPCAPTTVASGPGPPRSSGPARRSSRPGRPGPDPGSTTRCSPSGTPTGSPRSPRPASALGRQDWIDAAVETADFLLASLRRRRRTLAPAWQAETGAKHLAFAGDHAALVDAFTRLAEATGEARWLAEAGLVADAMLELFWDHDQGGLFTTGADGEQLVARDKDLQDQALPSANSTAAVALLRLAALTGGRAPLRRPATSTSCASSAASPAGCPRPSACCSPPSTCTHDGTTEVVVAGDRPDLVDVRPPPLAAERRAWPGVSATTRRCGRAATTAAPTSARATPAGCRRRRRRSSPPSSELAHQRPRCTISSSGGRVRAALRPGSSGRRPTERDRAEGTLVVGDPEGSTHRSLVLELAEQAGAEAGGGGGEQEVLRRRRRRRPTSTAPATRPRRSRAPWRPCPSSA